jgi:hypothetical protein
MVAMFRVLGMTSSLLLLDGYVDVGAGFGCGVFG